MVMFIIVILMVLWVYTYGKNFQTIHLKYVQVTACQLCLNKVSKTNGSK